VICSLKFESDQEENLKSVFGLRERKIDERKLRKPKNKFKLLFSSKYKIMWF
jgi:hypothetical protein